MGLKPISKSQRAGTASRYLVPFLGLVFIVAGTIMLYFLTVRPALLWAGARDWPAVECSILSSEVRSHSSSDGTTYSIDIDYRYEYEGNFYESNRYDFVGGSSSGYKGKKRIVDLYLAGSVRVCYVDPGDPEYAVLARDFTWFYLIGLFGLLFYFFGFLMLFGKDASSKKAMPQVAAPPGDQGAQESLALRFDSGASRKRALLLSGVGALALNAFVAVFAAIFYNTAGEEGFSENIVFFVVIGIFGLVGIALLVNWVMDLLRLWNAACILEITPSAIALGQSRELLWTLRGKVHRLNRLRFWLEGREWVRYRRGTDTSTETSVFEKLLILDTTNTADMHAGRVQFVLPEFTMHSLDSDNNKIEWFLKLEGNIDGWPDIVDEFQVHVAPLPSGAETAA